MYLCFPPRPRGPQSLGRCPLWRLARLSMYFHLKGVWPYMFGGLEGTPVRDWHSMSPVPPSKLTTHTSMVWVRFDMPKMLRLTSPDALDLEPKPMRDTIRLHMYMRETKVESITSHHMFSTPPAAFVLFCGLPKHARRR